MKYIFYGYAAETLIRHICSSIGSTPSHHSMSTPCLLKDTGVICFCDRAEELWGTEYFGLPVISPREIGGMEYDKVVISGLSADWIYSDLVNIYGIDPDMIIDAHARFSLNMREVFLRTVAQMINERGVSGSCAEGGVFRGDFSKIINECFPRRNLYLFDTFEGFVQKDVEEDKIAAKSRHKHQYLKCTSIDLVLSKLPHPNKAIVKPGWFPQTAEGIDDTFAFVNLDFDLYSPIKAGLEWFYPRMERGGVILVHDYFHSRFNCRKAVDEFCSECAIYPFPIGDLLSVGIIKN